MRLLMGVFEGRYTPVSIAATTEASRPERRGLNIGIRLGCFALIGLGFGPIILTQLLDQIHSWRGVFAVVAIPGLIVAYLMYRTIREPSHLSADRPPDTPAERYPWSAIFQHFGIQHTLTVGLFGLVGGLILSFFIRETAPRFTRPASPAT